MNLPVHHTYAGADMWAREFRPSVSLSGKPFALPRVKSCKTHFFIQIFKLNEEYKVDFFFRLGRNELDSSFLRIMYDVNRK